MVYVAYMSYRQSGSVIVSLITGALGVSMLFVGPREIRLSAEGIVQSGRFWVRPLRIAWKGIAVSYTPAVKKVMVIGSDGTIVTHCAYHVDQFGFLKELRRKGAFFHGDKVI